ncbi:MAG: hypothetical protein M3139_05350 [Bacteroidota bacterium]|nr:hypothetical protein [Bacteroidota bacterium]
MTRFYKYSLRTIAVIIGLLIVAYIILYAYVSMNKRSIITQVTEKIEKKINGNVTIGDVDLSILSTFPKIAVVLHNVSVTDTMFAKHHHTFFLAERVYIELGIMNLITKKPALSGLKVEKGSIYLYTDSSGYTNTYLIKAKSKDSATTGETTNQGKNDLESIVLKDVSIIDDDGVNTKLYNFYINDLKLKLDEKDSTTFFSLKSDVLVHNLAFKTDNGSFLKEKKFEGNFDFRYDKKVNQLQFDSIDIKLAGQPFNLSGRFDLMGPDPQFTLNVHTRQVLYNFAKTLLTPKIDSALSLVSLDKKLDADAKISGPLNGGDPLILVTWNVAHSGLNTPFLNFDDASFTGYYTDEVVVGEPRRDPNSKIVINNFAATWNGFPISSANITILNLVKPVMTCDLASSFPLKKINDMLGSNSIQIQDGEGTIDVTYKGPIEKNTTTNSLLNGELSFKNGNILYVPRGVEMKDVIGRLIFKNSDVYIQNLQCNVLNTKFLMNGEAKNLLTLMNTQPNQATIDWNIYTPSLNLSSFTYLLKTRKSSGHVKSHTNKINNIDDVLDEGSLHVKLHADKLSYKKFFATNTLADVLLMQNDYKINKVSMESAGGHVNLNGSLISQKENYHRAKANILLDNVDVSKVFESFNNFGQDGIKAQNLEGKLNAKVVAELAIDDDGKAYPNSVTSVVDFSLKNGALIDFEPVKKLQTFVFKNRDFQNIRFAELKDKLEIANDEIKINRMEIESNVLSMYVQGIYSMKGNTDMSIQVPLSNLKKRDADFIPKNKGADKKGGASIYIRGRPGSDGNIQFKLDLFGKFNKEQNKLNQEN